MGSYSCTHFINGALDTAFYALELDPLEHCIIEVWGNMNDNGEYFINIINSITYFISSQIDEV